MVIDAVLTTSRWAFGPSAGPNSGAGAPMPSFMPLAGGAGAVFSSDPAPQAASNPATAIPAIACVSHRRPSLIFIFANLAIGWEFGHQ
jgi:hypothetical protein